MSRKCLKGRHSVCLPSLCKHKQDDSMFPGNTLNNFFKYVAWKIVSFCRSFSHHIAVPMVTNIMCWYLFCFLFWSCPHFCPFIALLPYCGHLFCVGFWLVCLFTVCLLPLFTEKSNLAFILLSSYITLCFLVLTLVLVPFFHHGLH